ncbi:MAG TPA: potassium channel family protein [Steroidobacteraceae bacterium]|nr:potassium channel family protein [Steroidobacteraceae bacterium]
MSKVQQQLVTATQTGRVLIRIGWALIVLLVLLGVGTLGFQHFGPPGTATFDAFYMTAITITTVGYAEVVDLSHSHAGRIFAAFVGFAGFGTVTFIFSSLTVFFLETDLNEALRRRRMERTISKLRNHFIVCGIGRVGRNVATELMASGYPFVAIETSREEIERFLDRHPGFLSLEGDASDDDHLVAADIAHARGVFALTGDDSRNLMICLTARQLNPTVRIVARCHEVRNTEKMRKAGADVVVSPDFTGGMRMAASMIRPQVVSFLDEMLRSELNTRIDEVVVPPGFLPRTLGTLGRRSDQYVLLGVRAGDRMHFNPPDEFLIESGQTLILMGNAAGRNAIETELRTPV